MKPSTFLAMRQPLVWLIAVAIVAYGYSATVVQLLGPAHRHEVASTQGLFGPVADMVRDLQAWRADLHSRWMPHEAPGTHEAHEHGHPHSHAHGVYERHHHDPGDASVVVLDNPSGGSAAADTTAGSAALPLALAPRLESTSPARVTPAWPMPSADRWTDAARRLSERPPRA